MANYFKIDKSKYPDFNTVGSQQDDSFYEKSLSYRLRTSLDSYITSDRSYYSTWPNFTKISNSNSFFYIFS